MNCDYIDPLVDSKGDPTPLTRYLSHALVGAAAAYVIGQSGGDLGVILLGLLITALIHEAFDAPVAKAIAQADLTVRAQLT